MIDSLQPRSERILFLDLVVDVLVDLRALKLAPFLHNRRILQINDPTRIFLLLLVVVAKQRLLPHSIQPLSPDRGTNPYSARAG